MTPQRNEFTGAVIPSVNDLMDKADGLMKAKLYSDAFEGYQEILHRLSSDDPRYQQVQYKWLAANNACSADEELNLGKRYQAGGNYGIATICFLRALEHLDFDSLIYQETNLLFAQNAIKHGIMMYWDYRDEEALVYFIEVLKRFPPQHIFSKEARASINKVNKVIAYDNSSIFYKAWDLLRLGCCGTSRINLKDDIDFVAIMIREIHPR
jgi:tetratricopeptide (TPR) repeat protein